MNSFIKGVGFAIAGIKFFFTGEQNGRIQLGIAFLVVVAGLFTGISTVEWCLILFCIAIVLSLEMVNTAIERICNMQTTEFHPTIKIIKDVAAAAVLWSAFISAIIGLVIFIPYIKSYLVQ